MALSFEANTDLAFDTDELKQCAYMYAQVADAMRTMATDLDQCLANLAESGWTTDAGKAFHEMSQTNWKENINKYADLLDMLKEVLDDASTQYNTLVSDHIEKTKL